MVILPATHTNPAASASGGTDSRHAASRSPQPQLNPWTTLVELPQGRLRLVTANRDVLDFSSSEATDIRETCRRLNKHHSREKIEASASGRRGLLTLLHLGQLVDPDPPAGLAPPPLPLEIGIVGFKAWANVISSALSGFDTACVTHLEHWQSSRAGEALDTLSLIVMVGELDWALVHRVMTAGINHVLITPSATSVDVSQIVSPGRSCCLRCVHLFRTDTDPHWSTTARHLGERVPPSSDPALMMVAAAVLAAKLYGPESAELAAATGHRITAPTCEVQATAVAAHPHCPTCQHLTSAIAASGGTA